MIMAPKVIHTRRGRRRRKRRLFSIRNFVKMAESATQMEVMIMNMKKTMGASVKSRCYTETDN